MFNNQYSTINVQSRQKGQTLWMIEYLIVDYEHLYGIIVSNYGQIVSGQRDEINNQLQIC